MMPLGDKPITKEQIRVLLVGETWVESGTHIKGSNVFVQPRYKDGGQEFVGGLENLGVVVERLPAHLVPSRFPNTIEALGLYDVVVISDVGADSFELTPECLAGRRSVRALQVLADWVAQGGALLMIGGYMSFSGISGAARFQDSPLADVLPVHISPYDDRVERSDGVDPKVVDPGHAIMVGLPGTWPCVLGYNRVRAKANASVLATVDQDPLLTVGTHGLGRVAAYSSDCAPHWASLDFLKWSHYSMFFNGLVKWLSNREGGGASFKV
jgi:uncharacterized membrane protein